MTTGRQRATGQPRSSDDRESSTDQRRRPDRERQTESARSKSAGRLQHHLGNQAIQARIDKLSRPAAMESGDPRAEREADRIASSLLETTGSQRPGTDRSPSSGSASGESVQRSPAGERRAVSRQIRSPSVGGGRQLPDSLRAQFEPQLGYDLGNVRIHTGPAAAQVSRSVNAKAFTYGRDVFFGAGEYQPHTRSGRELVAHELTHVVQQSRTGGGPVVQRQAEGSGSEPILSPSSELEKKLEEKATETIEKLVENKVPHGKILLIIKDLAAAAGDGIGKGIQMARAAMKEEERGSIDMARVRGDKHLQPGVEKFEGSSQDRLNKYLRNPTQTDRKYLARAAEKLHIVAKEMFIAVIKKGTLMLTDEVFGYIKQPVYDLGGVISDMLSEHVFSYWEWIGFDKDWESFVDSLSADQEEQLKQDIKTLVDDALRSALYDQK